jgi:hypothetical protein
VLALALLAAGCGGDPAALTQPPAPTTPAPVDPAGSTVATTTPAEDPPGANELSNADATAGKLVKVSAITPKKFATAHCSKPIMVVFYQPESILDAQLYAQAKDAASKVDGVVSLAYTPRDVKAFGDLPTKLGLLSTPGIATVGRDGTIENFWTTYVDSALIERSLENAERSKPCKVSSADVPAAGSALADATLVANGGNVSSTGATAGAAAGDMGVDMGTDTLAGSATAGATAPAAGAIDPATGMPTATVPVG